MDKGSLSRGNGRCRLELERRGSNICPNCDFFSPAGTNGGVEGRARTAAAFARLRVSPAERDQVATDRRIRRSRSLRCRSSTSRPRRAPSAARATLLGPMPLTLITGPANAAKAGAVLERLRAALPRDPLLVVPTAADVEHYQRELAGSGIVFGAEVLTFARLVREIASRTGLRARRSAASRATASYAPRSPTSRCGSWPARRRRPGSPTRRARCSPSCSARWSRRRGSRRRCAGRGPARERPRAAVRRTSSRALYAAYRRRLERLGRPDREGHAWAALDALRADPARMGRAAGLPLRLRRPDADRARRGRDAQPPRGRRRLRRAAVRARPGRVRRPRGDRRGAAAARGRGRAPARALRALRAVGPAGAASPGARAVRAGARPTGAERRRAAARGRRRAGRGGARRRRGARADAPGDRGAGHRGAAAQRRWRRPRCSPRCSPATGSRSATTAASRSPARGSAPACWPARARRCPAGRAADLLTWLRTPGRLADAAPADALEARVRRGGVRDRPRGAGGLGDAARRAAADRARRPRRRRRAMAPRRCWPRWRPRPRRSGRRRTVAARRCSRPEDLADARVAADVRAATAELRALAAADPDPARCAARPARRARASRSGSRRGRGGRARTPASGLRGRRPILRSIARIAADSRQPDARAGAGVLLADPLAIRARRFRAVFVCGLQDGEFPRRPVPEPFLSDDDRRGLAAAAGLRLPLHEDVLDRERSLFYAAVSRPEDVLFLSWRSSDEEGDPLAPSVVPRRRRARCSPTTSGRSAARACSPTSPGRRRTRRRRTSCDARMRRPQRSPILRRSARPPPAPCSACSPRARPSRHAAWRRSPAAACAG